MVVDLLRRAAALARWGNLLLLLLYPLSWTAPLLKAGLLPLFGMSEISVLSGLAALWQSDRFLALVVALFALVAPMAKTAGLALVSFGLAPRCWLSTLTALGRLAMADVFLVALYVTLAKGLGVGRVDTAWGLYLFTGCILASLLFGTVEKTLAQDR
ncbi:Paraquat-inducible protein A [Rhodobacteraceae bacterium PD-2]|nr:Paraquat-inducible protein A [Rhodobacteraceae bacterium PD-2]